MDECRFILANRLVGNPDDAPCLEATIVFPKVRFLTDRIFSVMGAVANLTIIRGTEKIGVQEGKAIQALAGDILSGGSLSAGCRAYLAVAGGLSDMPLLAGPLADRDRLTLASAPAPKRGKLIFDPIPMPTRETVLRVIEGVHADCFSQQGQQAFYTTAYTYTPKSDRMGIRLEGEPVTFQTGFDGNIISEGMMPGDIQIVSAAQPILMMADCQTVGGYTKIAHVITADLPLAAQIRPGNMVRFRKVTVAEAQAAWRKLWYQMSTAVTFE